MKEGNHLEVRVVIGQLAGESKPPGHHPPSLPTAAPVSKVSVLLVEEHQLI